VRHPGTVTELLTMEAAGNATLTSFTRDGTPADTQVDHDGGATRLTTVLRLPRGAVTTYRLTYTVPVEDGRYRLMLVPQALARPADLHVHVHVVDGTLGVSSGIDQPRNGTIDTSGPWDSSRDVVIPVHGYTGLRGIEHSIAHFWTHKVSL
jgi:hypothetical protein